MNNIKHMIELDFILFIKIHYDIIIIISIYIAQNSQINVL